jgi:hypothetical protein
MKLLKQLTLVLAIAFSFASISPAMAAGKIENATAAQVKEAVEAAISSSEQALLGVQNDANQEVVLQHITSARQDSKRIEVGRLDVKRNQGSAKLKDARTAVTKGEKDKAIALLTDAVKIYQDIKASL